MAEARLAATEAQLADAEAMLRDALQSSLSWLWESDDQLRFTRIAGPIEQLLGTPAEALIGKTIEEFSRAPNDPQVQNHLATIRARKPYRDVVTSISTHKGVRWVKASGKPLFDAEGKFLGYRGIASDVTAQVETERRAAEAHRRFMEAIETVPASLMLCDRDDRIVFCNSATQRFFPTASHLLIPGTKYEDLLRAHTASGVVAGVGDDVEGWIAARMKQHRSGNTNITRAYKDNRWSQIIERRTSDGGIIGVRLDITELKKHEKEHEAAQARLKDAIETMPASFVLYDREERILLRNDQAEKFFPEVADLLVPGAKIEDLTRTRYRRLHRHASEAEIERAVQKRLQQFRNPGVIPPDQLPDGRWTQAIERRTADGGTVCVRIDITELKQRERELEAVSETLRKSQEHLTQAQRTSGTGSMERDLKTGEVKWSDECGRMFGRDLALPPPLRHEFLTLVHPDDRPIYESSMIASETGVASEPFKFRAVHGDGAVHWLYCESTIQLDADGKPSKRTATYRDITVEHEAEEALRAMADELRRNQEYLSQAQRLAQMGSDFRDLRSDVAEWSDTSYEIFGVDKTFVPTTENFLKLVHPDDHAIVARTRGEIAAGKNPEPFEYRIIRPDGAIRHIARECAVEFDANGKPLFMVGTIRDVTAKRAHEQALRRKSAEIEERNAELQRSNSELEQFAYVASHDLQEPLRMVASYCQLLQRRYKDKLDTDANEFIAFAVEGASRMQRLINDLLAYSRVGRKGGDPAPFEFVEAVDGALARLKSAIADSGAVVTVGSLPRIVGVRMQLTQLMQNLIGNAIKFRRDGVAPAISVTATSEGAMHHIVVEDNGIGIEPQYLERVFLIFQRLHERNKYPGTGIGLAIAKKVIEYHGGRIWIESTPGQGSRFNFTLPAAIQNGAHDA